MKKPIPEPLRQQLSRAGKIGMSKMSKEDHSRGGKASWAARLARAAAAEQQKKAEAKASTKPQIIINPSMSYPKGL